MVDYDDDEDDEDYKPPPRKQPENDEDEGTIIDPLRLKRKLPSKDKEPEQGKKQRLGKNLKSKDNVFAALCTTLSQAVLPGNKPASTVHASSRTADGDNKSSGEENHQENEPAVSRDSPDNSIDHDENHRENEPVASRSCSELLHATSENRQLGGGEDCPLIPPKSSPEMAVNGS